MKNGNRFLAGNSAMKTAEREALIRGASALKSRVVTVWDRMLSFMRDGDYRYPRTQSGKEIVTVRHWEDGDETFSLDFRPAVFQFSANPRRPAGHQALWVVLEGRLDFATKVEVVAAPVIHISGFGTHLGYFTDDSRQPIEHVLGMHFDVDKSKPSHPRFHAQHRSMLRLFEVARGREGSLKDRELKDRMQNVAGRVRVPTSHHDPLSALIQLFADNLVEGREESAKVMEAFRSAIALQQELFGPLPPRPAVTATEICVRTQHWYCNGVV
jgi:hypothetical protein